MVEENEKTIFLYPKINSQRRITSPNILSINRWLRIACLVVLELIKGCAHSPKPVPTSELQNERQICLVAEVINDGNYETPGFGQHAQSVSEKIYHTISDRVRAYLNTKYSNINVRDLGVVRRFRPSVADMSYWRLPSLTDYIEGRREKFIDARCDDVIGISVAAGLYRNQPPGKYGDSDFYDLLSVATQISVMNTETYGQTTHTQSLVSHREALGKCDPNKFLRCVRRYRIPVEELIETLRDEIDDQMDEKLLVNYNPDRLPALSAQIKALQTSREESQRITRELELKQENDRNKRVRLSHELQEAPENQAIKANIQIAVSAENNGDYERARKYYSRARDAWLILGIKYRRAGIPIPNNTVKLGRFSERKVIENEQRIIYPSSSSHSTGPAAVVEEGLKLLGESLVMSAPAIVRGVEAAGNLFEPTDAERKKYEAQGLTAELEIKLVSTSGLRTIPHENIEIRVRGIDNGTDFTKTTTKQGLLEMGGRVGFCYLRPGRYEISSPLFGTETITVSKGANFIDFELR